MVNRHLQLQRDRHQRNGLPVRQTEISLVASLNRTIQVHSRLRANLAGELASPHPAQAECAACLAAHLDRTISNLYQLRVELVRQERLAVELRRAPAPVTAMPA